MNSLEKLYQAPPRQRSPESLDQQIRQHAEQHAERRSGSQHRTAAWLPFAASAAIACVAVVLVVKPGFDRGSQPYSPPAATEETSEQSLQKTEARAQSSDSRLAVDAPQADSPADSAFDSSDADTSGIAAHSAVAESTPAATAESPSPVEQSPLQQEIAELADRSNLPLSPTAGDAGQAARAATRKQTENRSRRSEPPATQTADNADDLPVSSRTTELSRAQRPSTAGTEVSTEDTHARRWISEQPANAYTIQLAVARNLERLKRDIERASIDNSRVYFIAVPLREDTGYAALYGSWTSISAAYNAAESMTLFEPWVRQFSEFQSQ